jgi:hypothetical protein
MPKRKSVKMSKSAFIKEHKKLVKVLKKGNKKQRMNEAKKQSREL